MTLSNGAGLRGHLGWVLGVCVVAVVSMEPLATAAPEGRFGWPLQPRPAVVRRFDKPTHDWLPGHRGVDLAGGEGQPVLSAGEGIVVFAGTVADKPVVSIDHPGASARPMSRFARRCRWASGWGAAPGSAHSSPATRAARRRACTGERELKAAVAVAGANTWTRSDSSI